MSDQNRKNAVKNQYAAIALESGSCCGPRSTCCSPEEAQLPVTFNESYDGAEQAIVSVADLGLGCGTPVKTARLEKGMTVVDLGSGAGIDIFLAAREVGPGVVAHFHGVAIQPEREPRQHRAGAEDDAGKPEVDDAEAGRQEGRGDGDPPHGSSLEKPAFGHGGERRLAAAPRVPTRARPRRVREGDAGPVRLPTFPWPSPPARRSRITRS